MYTIKATVKTDSIPDKLFYLSLDEDICNMVDCEGTNISVDAFMDCVCNSIALGIGDCGHFSDVKEKNIKFTDVTNYRDGTSIKYAWIESRHDVMPSEEVEFVFDNEDHITVNIRTRTENITYETDYSDLIDFGSGIKILLGLIIRKKCKFITYLFDHISIFDQAVHQFYSSDKEILAMIHGDKEINPMIQEKYGDVMAPVYCSMLNKNYTIIIAQANQNDRFDDDQSIACLKTNVYNFFKNNPMAFPITIINTYPAEGEKKRNPLSGTIGRMYKNFMINMIGQNPMLESLMNYIIGQDRSDENIGKLEDFCKEKFGDIHDGFNGFVLEVDPDSNETKISHFDNPEDIKEFIEDNDAVIHIVDSADKAEFLKPSIDQEHDDRFIRPTDIDAFDGLKRLLGLDNDNQSNDDEDDDNKQN